MPFFKNLRIMAWKLPYPILKVVIVLKVWGMSPPKVHITKVANLILLTSNDSKAQLYISRPQRIKKYRYGIEFRLTRLLNEYMFDQIGLNESDVILDIGSNIGEVALALRQTYGVEEIYCFEPEDLEATCCDLNFFEGNRRTIRIALTDKTGEQDFFHANETGDSSLLPSAEKLKFSKVQTSTLDDFLISTNIKKITVMKLEAEGLEPEILVGATKTLSITRWVTADLGPERGLRKESTFNAATAVLISQNFELISSFPGSRETYLYKNMNY
jgi:FkbM family methyltransferase